MKTQLRFKLVTTVALLCLLALPLATYAAEEPAPSSSSGQNFAAPGISTLVLLMGIGAVLAVGLFTGVRENYRKTKDE